MCSAIDNYMSTLSNRVVGEKGTNLHSLRGMTDNASTPRVQGALVALNTHLVRGSTSTSKLNFDQEFRNEKISLINNVFSTMTELSMKDRALYMRDLVVLTFQKRDIRGPLGGGERTLSYWMYLRLHEDYPITMESLLSYLPNIGSWLDLKKLYEIASEDIKRLRDGYCTSGTIQFSKTAATRRSRINFVRKIVSIWTIQCQMDEITLNSPIKSDLDSEDRTLSLNFKWIPKPKSSLDRKYKVCSQIARSLYPSLYESSPIAAAKRYRKLVSRGNATINTTERLMCSKQFGQINFRLVPGRCLNKFHKAWKDVDKKGCRRHIGDEDRDSCIKNYMDFIVLVNEGKVNAKGKSLFIHEIVREVCRGGGANAIRSADPQRYILLEAQFRDHVTSFIDCSDVSGLDETVFLTDVSGSMSGDPLHAAVGISVLGSSITTGPYRNRLLTFESTPRWISLEYPKTEFDYNNSFTGYNICKFPLGDCFDASKCGKELDYLEKITVTLAAGWGGSTDFIKALNLIYKCAQIDNIPMPKRVFCLTDMEWDQADQKYENSQLNHAFSQDARFPNTCDIPYMTGSYLTSLEHIRNYFNSTAWEIPEFVVWNLRGDQTTSGSIAAADTPGVQMISGFSTSMLKLFVTEGTFGKASVGGNSWETLRQLIDHDSYDEIRRVVGIVAEKEFNTIGGSVWEFSSVEGSETEFSSIDKDKVEFSSSYSSSEDFHNRDYQEEKIDPNPISPYIPPSNNLPFNIDSLSKDELGNLLDAILNKL